MIQLNYCASCEKMKAHTVPAMVVGKDGTKTKGAVCLECASASESIIKAFKKLGDDAREKVVDYILNKVVGYRK